MIPCRLRNAVLFWTCFFAVATSSGFVSAFSSIRLPMKTPTKTTTQVGMGMFDFIQNAFKNEEYDDRLATASHILVESKDEAIVILKDIEEGTTTFADAAKTYSTCPSSSKGGSLGKFAPGTMVQEFDAVVFDGKVPIGSVQGPVSTQFGYHLILVEDRTVNDVRSEGEGFF